MNISLLKNINYKPLLRKYFSKRRIKLYTALFMLFILYWHSLPNPVFNDTVSTVLEDRDGVLLGAKIADDEQWRFPHNEKVSEKFTSSIIEFEDRNFYYHPGFNPLSFIRAMIQNIKERRIVSGGSTLSMQVIRMSRKGKKRNIFEKIIEIILATRLELTYSKKEILALYASNAPFGGNVVGLDAASWRYYGRSPEKLSWSESATLAVLPNSPALIFPGKNHDKLRLKRNRLLNRLKESGYIDKSACRLAKLEPLPNKPYSLPQSSIHLLSRLFTDGLKGKRIRSTISKFMQQEVHRICRKHHQILEMNSIHNTAAIIVEVSTGNVLAYVGNMRDRKHPEHGGQVDVINAPRSTGSILKPFLYAMMLNDGKILPNSLVEDVPTQIGSYFPKNYNRKYDGAIPASKALSRSLNVPAVRMLRSYGIEKFNYLMHKFGMTTLSKAPSHYGLTIILGGAEGKLWDIVGIYASMARTLNNYQSYNSMYCQDDFHPPQYISNENTEECSLSNSSLLDASSIWFTFEAMIKVTRPDEEAMWEMFESSNKVAWKTGTSYGNRDAWAIGLSPEYVVGVWVGNSDGEGRKSLTGISAAAPILFDIFKILESNSWFSKPYDDLIKMPVCRYSGHKASSICEYIDTLWVQAKGVKSSICPYHKIIHLDESGSYRVNSECESINNMTHKAWFVLPPVAEMYFKMKNPFYSVLPPLRDDCCDSDNQTRTMEIIYPKNLGRIYIPIDLDGEKGKTVFKVAHRNPATIIYWNIDQKFVGKTSGFHQMGLAPEPGEHTLTLVDENGEILSTMFEILDKRD